MNTNTKIITGKDDVELAIRRAKAMAESRLEASRASAMVITKLDEALLWLTLSNPAEYAR